MVAWGRHHLSFAVLHPKTRMPQYHPIAQIICSRRRSKNLGAEFAERAEIFTYMNACFLHDRDL